VRGDAVVSKRIITVYTATLVFFLFVSGAGVTAQEPETKSVRIKDATGRSVEVRLPVKRLVVLTSDALEIVRALKAEDLVVGVYSGISKDPVFWPRLKDKPKVGTWKELNYERVVALQPDIVLCYGQRPGGNAEKKLEPFGISVIRLDFFKLTTLEKEVETLGLVLGKAKEAQKLTAWYQKSLNFIRERIKKAKNRAGVYIEGGSNYHTTGPGSGGNDMCVLAGGRNIASGLSIPYPEVTPEWVLANNPGVIIKVTTMTTCGAGYTLTNAAALKRIRDTIITRPAWGEIDAVRQGRVYVMANEIWTGPRAVIGTGYMAKWFFPEILKDFDPESLHREYLEGFQGLRYDGLYVYP